MDLVYSAAASATRWLARRFGPLNLALFVLTATGLGSLVYGLAYTLRSVDLLTLSVLMASALLVGWALPRWRLRPWAAGMLVLAAGGLALLLWIGRMAQPLLALAAAAGSWVVQALNAFPWDATGLSDLDGLALGLAWSDFTRLGLSLAGRTWVWLVALAQGRPIFDPLAVLLVCGFATWALSAWAAWWVRRQKILLALAPAGALLALVLAGGSVSYNPILVWSGAVLLLQGLAGYIRCQRRWQASRAEQADIQAEWGLAAMAVVSICLTAALFAPNISLRKISDQIRDFFTTQGGVPGAGRPAAPGAPAPGGSGPPQGLTLNLAQTTGLPNIHLLGSGPELSQQVVFWVDLEGEEALPPHGETPSPDDAMGAYRWRGLNYERYSGRGWSSFPAYVRQTPPGALLAPEQPIESQSPMERVIQRVQMVSSEGGMLLSAGEPLSATVETRAALRITGEIFGAQLVAGEYRVISLRARPTIAQMQAATAEYPEWVREIYLELPEGLPRRVRQLALDLTAAQPTPYDRAAAIEAYLRDLPYTLDVPAPPARRDLVDYYLFDLQRGYCDYAASAMVVLARAAGLPARLAVGYAGGTYSPAERRFTVTAADAHAWAEVYFTGIGWVEFEPTGGRPPVLRPEIGLPGVPPPAGAAPEPSRWPGLAISPAGWALALGGTLLALLALLFLGLQVDLWRLAAAPPQTAIALVFRRLYRMGSWLATPSRASLTPHEYVARLHGSFQAALPTRMGRQILATVRQKLGALADLYARSLYSQHNPDRLARSRAIAAWKSLRPQLWRAAFWKLLKSKFRL